MIKKNLFLLLIILTAISCLSQESNKDKSTDKNESGVKLDGNTIISIDGYDVRKYEVEFYDLGIDYKELNFNHVLCLAAENCDLEMMKKLLSNGANANMICDVDHILTEIAFCDETAVEVTKLFLKHGADVNGSDEENSTFLSYAVGQDNIELVKLILANGGDPMIIVATTNLGCLAFHDCESIAMFELLRPYYKDLNVQCRNGRSLLHFCARENLEELARYILANKLIDKSLLDGNGESAFDYAHKVGNENLSKLLKY